jgi:hypothetical protein
MCIAIGWAGANHSSDALWGSKKFKDCFIDVHNFNVTVTSKLWSFFYQNFSRPKVRVPVCIRFDSILRTLEVVSLVGVTSVLIVPLISCDLFEMRVGGRLGSSGFGSTAWDTASGVGVGASGVTGVVNVGTL